MLFNSFAFLVFFLLVAAVYFALPHRFQWVWLLAASCVFYMAFIPVYIVILAASIVGNYIAALLISKSQGTLRSVYLASSLSLNIGVLAIFKYYNFFCGNINASAHALNANIHLPLLTILLPLGLSFHTFQAISYAIEVHRGTQQPERHLGIYALYIMFFPQLVAGPIERPQNLLPQLRRERRISWDNICSGGRYILWGLVLKVVVADRLAKVVDVVYSAPSHWSGGALLVATVLFSIQIYCDFAGYSYIAVGTARILGFSLMINFRQPYLSLSVSEFWKRWHISLSTWFKDYVYIPMGGNRVSWMQGSLNIAVVFAASGLWHGANWTFVVWGLLNGLYCLSERIAGQYLPTPKVPALAKGVLTFTLITIAWVFFRAASLSDALYITTHFFSFHHAGAWLGLTTPAGHGLPQTYLGLPRWEFMATLSLVPLVLVADWLLANGAVAWLRRAPAWISWPVYYSLVAAILVFGVFDLQQFIYFQF